MVFVCQVDREPLTTYCRFPSSQFRSGIEGFNSHNSFKAPTEAQWIEPFVETQWNLLTRGIRILLASAGAVLSALVVGITRGGWPNNSLQSSFKGFAHSERVL